MLLSNKLKKHGNWRMLWLKGKPEKNQKMKISKKLLQINNKRKSQTSVLEHKEKKNQRMWIPKKLLLINNRRKFKILVLELKELKMEMKLKNQKLKSTLFLINIKRNLRKWIFLLTADNLCSNKKRKEQKTVLDLTITMISEIQISANLIKTWDLTIDSTMYRTETTIILKDFLFLNLDIHNNIILNTEPWHKNELELEMIQLVVQQAAINIIMFGILMLGMELEVISKNILIAFHISSMEWRLFQTWLNHYLFQKRNRRKKFKVLVKSEMTQLDHQLELLNIYTQNGKNQHPELLNNRSWIGRTFIIQEITLYQALVWTEKFWIHKKMKELLQLYLSMLGLSRHQKAMKNPDLELRVLTIISTPILMKTWSIP